MPGLGERGDVVVSLSPQALSALTRTWAAILQDRYPELRSIRVSVVGEDEGVSLPARSTPLGQSHGLALPDEVESPVQRSGAA